MSLTENDIDALNKAIAHAKKERGGHLTILRFTTNWRVAFDTPERDDMEHRADGSQTDYFHLHQYRDYCSGATLEEAVNGALNDTPERQARRYVETKEWLRQQDEALEERMKAAGHAA